MKDHNYYVYILTNPGRTVLYVGITNNLSRRLKEHFDQKGKSKTFTGRYYCYKLLYYEHYTYALDAIEREKQIKRWRREKKEALINTSNPRWLFLNGDTNWLEY